MVGIVASVIAGLALGIAFMITLSITVNYQQFIPLSHLTDEQIQMVKRAQEESQAIRTFLAKYPSAYPEGIDSTMI